MQTSCACRAIGWMQYACRSTFFGRFYTCYGSVHSSHYSDIHPAYRFKIIDWHVNRHHDCIQGIRLEHQPHSCREPIINISYDLWRHRIVDIRPPGAIIHNIWKFHRDRLSRLREKYNQHLRTLRWPAPRGEGQRMRSCLWWTELNLFYPFLTTTPCHIAQLDLYCACVAYIGSCI
jgi:hypothetical protein